MPYLMKRCEVSSVYLRPAAVDDVIRRVISLALHLNRLLLVLGHLDPQNPKV